MTRAVTPKAMYNREGFEMLRPEGEEWFCEGESRMDNKVECDDRNPRFLMKPLEVVFRPYLNRSGFCEGEVRSRTIERAMI